MIDLIFQLLGGIGLFLLGMVLLTDGLKAFAGESLKRALIKFTGKPWKAFLSGAGVTVLVQSSSATTITVIGFVSAGLITFSQSVGVVLGASLGTTGTGWIVATLGLKISVGFYALPLVGIGALARLLTKGRLRDLGLALAGFGLIFIGIETLQVGMTSLSQRFDLSILPGLGILAYVLAMILGIILTVLMQSSSAAVATTLTALHSGAITFEHAAALVIGAAIGTTITGALAAIGGTTSAKRTAVAHVGFNLFTGLLALLLLPLFLMVIRWAQTHLGLDPGAVSLAAFHTMFISVGVLFALPFVGTISRKIEHWIPERQSIYVRHLDRSLLSAPEVALETVRRSLRELASASFLTLARSLPAGKDLKISGLHDRATLLSANSAIQNFLQEIPLNPSDSAGARERVDAFHALEHLNRLQHRVLPPESIFHSFNNPDLEKLFVDLVHLLKAASVFLSGEGETEALAEIHRIADALATFRKEDRPKVMHLAAMGKINADQSLDRLDAVRWIDRIGYHTARICAHLSGDA